MSSTLLPWVGALTGFLLVYGFWQALFVSPPDYQMGEAVRIMYVHVPSAYMGMLVYGSMAFASAIALIWKHPLADIAAKCSAPIGVAFTGLALATGMLWGQPMWGTFWVWDARLTSMVVLFCFYLAYIMTWKFVDNFEKANKISSAICIVGLFNLPVIRYSVDWWNTLHQPSSITLTSAPTIHHTMLIPLIIMLLGMTIYFLVIFFMRYKIELIKFKLKKKKYNKK